MEVKANLLGYVPAIVFKNESTGQIVTWVCGDAWTHEQKLHALSKQKHITILSTEPALVQQPAYL